jgi:hypothetical protein
MTVLAHGVKTINAMIGVLNKGMLAHFRVMLRPAKAI